MRLNKQGLIHLDKQTMTAIFECVYGVDDDLSAPTRALFKEDYFRELFNVLSTMQEFNYRYRYNQLGELFPIFEETVGPMESNSDGTSLWLAMGLAHKDKYGLRTETLKSLLKLVGIRK